ncbi:hypothetical protein SDC9_70295 [bioreactor metagenome]|uniref:Uncharacterized protein n=1 Tax=bioreactor metagenome TaxID=1076179 RepID=A0A644Y7B8_9ZZZZ|nr:hypothetical protein [Clostridiales bacterium]
MGKESSMKVNYEIIAYITKDKDRILSSNCLVFWADSDNTSKNITVEIAKAMKADVVKLTNGDYMIIRV